MLKNTKESTKEMRGVETFPAAPPPTHPPPPHFTGRHLRWWKGGAKEIFALRAECISMSRVNVQKHSPEQEGVIPFPGTLYSAAEKLASFLTRSFFYTLWQEYF